jgi:hypothetical protein
MEQKKDREIKKGEEELCIIIYLSFKLQYISLKLFSSLILFFFYIIVR